MLGTFKNVVWLLLSAGTLACASDEDCSLNGICSTDHACSCDPGWTGLECGRLDLRPAKKDNGYNKVAYSDSSHYGKWGNSSWGGQIIRDPIKSNTFHMFLDQFSHGCGLSSWRPHSQIVRVESKVGPQGPYEYQQTVTSTFRHNAYIFQHPRSQNYLLYSIGIETVPPKRCQSFKWANNISVSMAQQVTGPWSAFQTIMNGTNPAPWPLWSKNDHTDAVVTMVGDGQIYKSIAWDKKPKLIKRPAWPTDNKSVTWTEDPFIWRDKRGHWHALVHWMVDIVENNTKYPRVGAHLYSRSLEGDWTFKLQEAFNSTVGYTDGTSQTFKRRERPKIFFSDDEQWIPLYLVTGVQEMNMTAPSYTLVQPIGTHWREYEAGLR